MKRQLLTLAFVAATTIASYAQGTITFANTIASRTLIDYDGFGGAPTVPVPAGAPIVYGVFWGAAGTAEVNLTLAEGALGTAHATSAGIISAGSPYVIQGAAELSTVSIQIRAWESRFGRDWRTGSQMGIYGQTDVRQVRLAATAGPGTIIWQSATATATDRFNGLYIGPIPEPATIGLLALSLAGLLVFRRRRTGQ